MFNNARLSDKKLIIFITIFLAIVVLAVYGRVSQYDFVNYDDPIYVTDNNNIKLGLTLAGFRWAFSTTYAEFWHPLTWLSLMFDYQLYGFNAGGYHLTNLILHVLSTVLLFWLLNRMTGAIWKSACVAALFALHPLHVESVVWISERKDVLSAFFWMLTLRLYVFYTEKPGGKRYLLILFSFICGLMSKPMIITLPAVMIFLDYWPLGRFRSKKTGADSGGVLCVSQNRVIKEVESKEQAGAYNIYPSADSASPGNEEKGVIPLWPLIEKIPFFVLSAVFSIITLYAQYNPFNHHYPFYSRIANAPISFIIYVKKALFINDLAVFYPFHSQLPVWQVAGAALLILTISLIIIWTMKRLPYLFVGWFWYAITILPVIGIVQAGSQMVADRYTYIPLIGIFVMIVWGVPQLLSHMQYGKIIIAFSASVFLIIITGVTHQQIGVWKNDFTLYGHVLNLNPQDARAYHYLGCAMANKGENDKALYYYSLALKYNPRYYLPYLNAGAVFQKMNKMKEAIYCYNKVLLTNDKSAEAHYNLGLIFMKFNYHEAIIHFKKALEINPKNSDIHDNLGVALVKTDHLKEALEHFQESLRLNPEGAYARDNVENVSAALKKELTKKSPTR